MKSKALEIQKYILSHINKHPSDIATVICKRFAVTRMTATRHLQQLIVQHKIIKSGKTSDARYYLATDINKTIRLKITHTLDEFSVFKKYLDPQLKQLPKNQYSICEYCCTELINNAKDHSLGSRLIVKTNDENEGLTIVIADNGIGIFKKLQRSLKMKDMQESLLALTKGKVTTDPDNHTGEGVFFSSRLVDRFILEANGIRYTKDNTENDWMYEKIATNIGSTIILLIKHDCVRDIQTVFETYTDPEKLHFDKTEILVQLSMMGSERYISRSQAKRILTGLDRFSRIVMDFRDIETVGQGFVDEVFRVFQNKHPAIQITYRNANENVTFMIQRGLG